MVKILIKMIKLVKDKNGKYEIHAGSTVFKDKDKITGSIQNIDITGHIRIIDANNLYFCQDVKQGSNVRDKVGHKYSWVFQIDKYGTDFTSSVKIDYNIEDGHYNDVRKDTGEFKQYIYDIIGGVRKNESTKALFKSKAHPDCCGAVIYYNFDSSTKKEYSKYKTVNIERLKEIIGLTGASKIIHLAEYQANAHDLVMKLNAKPIHTYINKNSKNKITIYQID